MKKTMPFVMTAALLAAGAAEAFNPQPEPPAFGMVGLGRYQTAILNAVMTTPVDPTIPPDPQHPGCRITLSFVDRSGQVFRDRAGNEAKKTVTLRGNAAEALVLRASDILADDQVRAPIRAVMSGPGDETPSDCTGLVATLELVAPNGWTAVLYPSVGAQPPDDGITR